MAETIKAFNDSIQRVAEGTKSIDHHLAHSSISITGIVKTLFTYEAIVRGLETLMSRSRIGSTLSMAWHVAKTDALELRETQNKALNELNEFNARVQQRIQLGEITQEMANRERANLEASVDRLSAQVEFKSRLQTIGKAELALSSAFLASVTSAYRVFTETGRVLIETNASLSDRLELTRAILSTQQRLGSDMRGSVEAARDLVEYGYDLDSTFQSTLELVIQMRDGLGVSTKLGAELATVYERQLRTSARDIANSMARVVSDTALAADEAGRMATNIGRAVALLKPGVNADLGAVNELVGRYEGALKRLGGQFGGFSDLLTKMTTPEGMLQAGVIGVQNPEFLRSEQATKQVIDSFANYAKKFLGNTEGWERALRVQSLAEIFGTTAQQVNLMVQAVEEQNNQRHTSITIEQRYRDQVFATGEVLTRMKNSLVSLMQQAVLPVIDAFTFVLKPVADFLAYLQKMPGIVYVAGAVMIGGAIAATSQLYRLSTALYTMATAAHIAAVRVREQALANIAVPGVPAASGSALARTWASIGRFIGVAAGPIIAGAIGLAIGVTVGTIINRAYDKFTTFNSVALKNNDQEMFRAAVKRFAIAGDVAGVRSAMDWAQDRFTKGGMRPDIAAAKISNIVQGLDDVVGEMKFVKASAQHSLGVDPDFDVSMDKMNETQKELVKIATAQHAVAVESIKVQKDQEKKEQEFQFQQRMDYMLNKGNNIPRFENIYNPKK